jgi:amino acid transporter
MEVLLLFSSFTALACSFAAFAYAEFASMVPVQEVHTYSYVLMKTWIIGWALIMEYAIGNITVAISWSDYFTGLLESGGLAAMGSNGLLDSLHWIQRCNCLNAGWKTV